MNSLTKLNQKTSQGFHICVGLDTDINKIPKHLLNMDNPVLEFNKIIIENTYRHAAAYKINFAFYEIDGMRGFDNIQKTIELIPKDILTIGDAKRGDIGNTSEMYAKSIFDYFQLDSVTLNPYMGLDSILPFLNYKEKLIFILVLTSNKSAVDFEKIKIADGRELYQHVLDKVNNWNNNNNCGIVFGATQPKELEDNCNSFNKIPVLIPGIGAQGGDLNSVLQIMKKNLHVDFLLNVSRGIIYADSSPDFAMKINSEIIKLNRSIEEILGKN